MGAPHEAKGSRILTEVVSPMMWKFSGALPECPVCHYLSNHLICPQQQG
jgi:hypothetical protein